MNFILNEALERLCKSRCKVSKIYEKLCQRASKIYQRMLIRSNLLSRAHKSLAHSKQLIIFLYNVWVDNTKQSQKDISDDDKTQNKLFTCVRRCCLGGERTLSFITTTHDMFLPSFRRFRLKRKFVRSHQSSVGARREIDISINLCHLTSGSHSFRLHSLYASSEGNEEILLIPSWVVSTNSESL